MKFVETRKLGIPILEFELQYRNVREVRTLPLRHVIVPTHHPDTYFYIREQKSFFVLAEQKSSHLYFSGRVLTLKVHHVTVFSRVLYTYKKNTKFRMKVLIMSKYLYYVHVNTSYNNEQ